MAKKTDEELRALWAIFEDGAAYEDFPDGATWADLKDALELHKKEHPDA